MNPVEWTTTEWSSFLQILGVALMTAAFLIAMAVIAQMEMTDGRRTRNRDRMMFGVIGYSVIGVVCGAVGAMIA